VKELGEDIFGAGLHWVWLKWVGKDLRPEGLSYSSADGLMAGFGGGVAIVKAAASRRTPN
jgi:hypothetical protein